MPRFDPNLLARWTAGRWTRRPTGELTGFTIDSRQARAGDMFVALRTERRDGHDFLSAAQAAGASAALVERVQPSVELPQLVVADALRGFQAVARDHRREFARPVVGITGSAGKTSTKNLVARLLGPRALATAGNLNNFLGVPLTLTRLDSAQHDFAVIEAGISEPREMATLASMIEPDVAIVTLIGAAHTEKLGGIEGVAREKAVMAAAVRPGGVAVLTDEVARYEAFQSLTPNRIVVRRVRALEDAVDGVIPYVVTHDTGLTRLEVRHPAVREALSVEVVRVSDGMASNVALSVVAALWLGVQPEEIAARVKEWTPATLRGEVRQVADCWMYLDCYNANPASMMDALRAFAEMAPAGRPRVYVVGGMEELGDQAERYHEELGRQVPLRAGDELIVLATAGEAVRRGALAAGAEDRQVTLVTTVGEVRERLRDRTAAVFVKGSRKYHLEEILIGLDPVAPTLDAH